MIYLRTITTGANTTEPNAKETGLKVGKGLVWRIEVEFPAGCSGLVHLQIFDGAYQLFPATPGESFRGDNVVAGYDDLYLKESAPYNFTVKTWNEDTLYDHTVQVRVGFASAEAFMSRYMPSLTWEKFAEVWSKAAEQQEAQKQQTIETLQAETAGFEQTETEELP